MSGTQKAFLSIRNDKIGLEELKPNNLRLGRTYSHVQTLKSVSPASCKAWILINS